VSANSHSLSGPLERFAATLLHDVRTPLSAMSGEVELALRRTRTAGEYRETLVRLSQRVSELVDLTDDLALLGNPSVARERATRSSALMASVEAVGKRFDGTIDLVAEDVDVQVVGEAALVTRALTLLTYHAIRTCRPDAKVRCAIRPQRPAIAGRSVDIVFDAPPTGFWPNAWRYLASTSAPDGLDPPPPVRLRTASLIVDECGGTLSLVGSGTAMGVQVRWREASRE